MTAYYVNQGAGSDGANGLSPGTAWKTMGKLSSTSFSAGDIVLLNRGDVWRETWYVNTGGSLGNPVAYGAYGSGALPRVTGCDLLTGWVGIDEGGLFSDGFETADLSRWSATSGAGANLLAHTDAAMVGTYGLKVTIPDTTARYVRDNTPNDTTYRVRFRVNTAGLTMASGDEFLLAQARTAASADVWLIKIQWNGGTPTRKLFFYANADSGSVGSVATQITDAAHVIEVEWVSSTAPGANNGIFRCYVDGVSVLAVTNADTDTKIVDHILLGATGEIDAGTSGTLYLDSFASNNTGAAIGSGAGTATVYRAPYVDAITTYVLLEDGNHLTKVASLALVNGVGKFFPDNAADAIYVRCTDSLAPSTHTMEIGARYEAVVCDDRSYVTFDSIWMHGAGGQFGRSFGLKPTFSTPTGITLTNCRISHANYSGVWVYYNAGFTPISNVTFSACEVDHNLNFGVNIEGQDAAHRVTGVLLTGCLIHDNGNATFGQFGVYMHFVTAPTVTLCSIYDNSGTLSWSDNLYFTSCPGAVASYNVVHGGNHSGIHFDVASNGFVCHHNVVYGCAWNGIWVEEHLRASGTSVVAHNTVYGCVLQSWVFGPGGTDMHVTGVTVVNNIFSMPGRWHEDLNNASTNWADNTVDYNLYYMTAGTGPFHANLVDYSFVNYKSTTGFDAHSIVADPLLVNGAGADFHLQAGSPARNAGTVVAGVEQRSTTMGRYDATANRARGRGRSRMLVLARAGL